MHVWFQPVCQRDECGPSRAPSGGSWEAVAERGGAGRAGPEAGARPCVFCGALQCLWLAPCPGMSIIGMLRQRVRAGRGGGREAEIELLGEKDTSPAHSGTAQLWRGSAEKGSHWSSAWEQMDILQG